MSGATNTVNPVVDQTTYPLADIATVLMRRSGCAPLAATRIEILAYRANADVLLSIVQEAGYVLVDAAVANTMPEGHMPRQRRA